MGVDKLIQKCYSIIKQEDKAMEKFVEYEKLSKKEKKARNRLKRVLNGFNTGTRSMKSNKDYNRAEYKRIKEEEE